MGLHAAGKGKQAYRDVGDLVMEVVAALRVYCIRHLSHQTQDHRYIMRRKGPQNVLFTADFPEIQTVRIDIFEFDRDPRLQPIFSV